MAGTEIAAKYSPLMSWFYDRFAADAVLSVATGLIETITRNMHSGGSSVLEVGCGGGQLAHRLIDAHPGISVTGIDLSAEQISRAIRRSKALPPRDAERVHFQTASALDLPFADNSFDAVISVASVKHWSRPERGISEMLRVLKEGGAFLLAETDRGCHLSDARHLVLSTRLPVVLRLPYLWMFRTYVAGQSLDLDDARNLVADESLAQATVERIPDAPFFTISGTKAPAAQPESFRR